MSLQPHVVGHKNMSITIALGVMVMLLLFSSCSGRKKEMGAAITERDSLPVMDTKGVKNLIFCSDFRFGHYPLSCQYGGVADLRP